MGIVKTVISEDMSKKAIYSCRCIKLITGKESQSELKNQGFSLVENCSSNCCYGYISNIFNSIFYEYMQEYGKTYALETVKSVMSMEGFCGVYM